SPADPAAETPVTPPTGFGSRLGDTGRQVLSAFGLFPPVPLDPTLAPAADLTYQPGPTIYAAEESKPVWIVTDRIIWHIASGKFDLPPLAVGAQYVQADEYNYLTSVSNNLVDPPNMGTKRSNDKYWLSLSGAGSLATVQP